MNGAGVLSTTELRDVVVEPLGEFAFLVRNLKDPWRYGLDLPGVEELVPARFDLGVYLNRNSPSVSAADILSRLVLIRDARELRSTIKIPVCYDGADLAELDERIGQSAAALHQSAVYQVQFIGFMPGFPYLTGLPKELRGLPRRATPRPRVPSGSVAIADEYSGVYPAESPGGWWLIGRTPIQICDPESDSFLLQPGDSVRFRSITQEEFEAYP